MNLIMENMKTAIWILAFVLATAGPAMAQQVNEGDVPAEVKSTFTTLYPGNKAEKWEMKNGNYEAKLANDTNDLCVRIDRGGALIETEAKTRVSALPALALTYVIQNYPSLKISEARIITGQGGRITYKAQVGQTDLYFDNMGSFIRSEMRDDEGGKPVTHNK